MNFVIFGLSVSSSWGNGHAALWRGLIRALVTDRHRVIFYERDVPYYAEHRDLYDLPSGAELVLYDDWDEIAPQARRALGAADIGMVTSYCPDAAEAEKLVLESTAPVRCFYDLDTPVTLARLEAGDTVDYIGPDGLRGYDMVLSYTGGAALQALRDRLGARRVAPVYGSVDPSQHRIVLGDRRFALSYLGTFAEDRQQALDALFVQPARQRAEAKFAIAGAQYPQDFPWTDNMFFLQHLPPDAHPGFYANSRLTLNVTRSAMAQMGWCPSGRLFEAAACGVPILTDWWDGLDDFFTPGESILVARTTEDALDAIDRPQAELDRIARAAREQVLGRHTATVRAREMVAALQSSMEPV